MTDCQRPAYFFYQKGMSGNWQPVVQFDEAPKTKDGYEIREGCKYLPTTEPVELTLEDKLAFEASQSFAQIKRKYPNPNDTTL